jgi:flagellar biogenesis protein FliO
MSLKGFHIVFITFSTLLALGCGIWCVQVNQAAQAPVYLAGAIGSFVAALGLLIYGFWFYRKMKRLRIFT